MVTAQKRVQNTKEVPISIATLGGEKFDAIFSGGDDVQALAIKVPGLFAESSNGRAAPRFYIRGLGNTDFDLAASQPVSIIMDDVVMENVVLKSFPLFDVESLEVIRGPQGTLFAQVMSREADGMVAEAKRLNNAVPDIVVKIPVTAEGLAAIKQLKKD